MTHSVMIGNGLGGVIALEKELGRINEAGTPFPHAIKVHDRLVFTFACCYPKLPARDENDKIIPVIGYLNKFTGKVLPVVCDQESLGREPWHTASAETLRERAEHD